METPKAVRPRPLTLVLPSGGVNAVVPRPARRIVRRTSFTKETVIADSAARGNGEAGTRSAGVWTAGTPPFMRERLPIPVPRYVGLTTYDAKDPNTKYPPIARLQPRRERPR